ncbi:MAG: hypothetical protein JNJ69_00575 [Leptospiraceae bacterium]|nr:hypothetical protein [Leptospiraceae bacterium]
MLRWFFGVMALQATALSAWEGKVFSVREKKVSISTGSGNLLHRGKRIYFMRSGTVTGQGQVVEVFHTRVEALVISGYVEKESIATDVEEVKKPEPALSKYGILEKIENYSPPPYPETKYSKMEAYDYRIFQAKREGKKPEIPESKIETWICDLAYIGNECKKEQFDAETFFESLRRYRSVNYRNICGFRPHAHWHFVKNLAPAEMRPLILQSLDYLAEKGKINCYRRK